MKEYLHLFDEVKADHIGKFLPCVSDIDNKFIEFRMSEVYCSVTGVFHDNEGFTISHVLDLSKLTRKKPLDLLLEYSDRYEINVQFWPDQTAVFIEKGGVPLADFGGDEEFAIVRALEYLNRINQK